MNLKVFVRFVKKFRALNYTCITQILFWDAMFKLTDIQLELLTDINMYIFEPWKMLTSERI